MTLRRLKNTSGMTMINALIAVAMIGILIVIMTSFLSQSNQGAQNIRRKTDVVDTKNEIGMALAHPLLCGCSLNPSQLVPTAGTPITFDSTAADNTQVLELPLGLRNSCASTSPAFLLPGSRTSAGLIVSRIYVTDMQALPTAAPTDPKPRWLGKLTIAFAPGSGELKLKDVSMPISIDADVTVPAVATVTSCTVSAGGSGGSGLQGSFGGIYSWHYTYARCESDNPFTGDCSCPTGYTAKRIIHNGTDDGSPGDNQDIFFCYR